MPAVASTSLCLDYYYFELVKPMYGNIATYTNANANINLTINVSVNVFRV